MTQLTSIPKEYNIWDKRSKKWIGLKEDIFTGEDIFRWRDKFKDDTTNLVFCQFTGLHDYVHQKIFEYDIVKNTKKGNVYFVKWFRSQARFNISEEYIKSGQLEKIGNVFENLNLLPEKYQQKVKEEVLS